MSTKQVTVYDDFSEKFFVDFDENVAKHFVTKGRSIHQNNPGIFAIDFEIEGVLMEEDDEDGFYPSSEQVINLCFVRVYSDGTYAIVGTLEWNGVGFDTDLLM